MKHTSVILNTPIEFVNITRINPFISQVQIKVCWVGEQPNRNKSIITKDVAKELANSLPGSPIVGYYNEEKEDFEGHERALEIKNGKITFKDTTRPYGFVDLGAKVWFQRFLDDGQFEREYLMTEGWIWTGQYPEARRIVERGNNQSMELDEETLDATWTKNQNGAPQFFIINEGFISKLCTLGEDTEPCFETASITKPIIEFSLGEDFKEQVYSMMNEIKELLNKGGTEQMTEQEVIETGAAVEEPVAANENPNNEENLDNNEQQPSVENEEVIETEFEEKKCPECGKPLNECTCEEEPKRTYNLEEVVEYAELQTQYADLESRFNALQEENTRLTNELAPLVEFKRAADKKEKEAMIDTFYMLSDEDKKDVVDNIDKYSVDEIEAKLSIICVRNKVSFSNLDENKPQAPTTYNLDNTIDDDAMLPEWVKAALEVAKNNNI